MQDYDAFKDLIENRIPFNAYLGIRLLSLEPGLCRLLVPHGAALVGDTRRDALHGGVISTLVDTCGGFTVWAASGLADRISTIDLRVDYLKPAIGCSLVAEGHLKLLGNRVGNAHVVVHAEGDPSLVLAEGRGVYNIRKARA